MSALRIPERTPIASPAGPPPPEWLRFFQDMLMRLQTAEAAVASLLPTAPGASGTWWNDNGVLRLVP